MRRPVIENFYCTVDYNEPPRCQVAGDIISLAPVLSMSGCTGETARARQLIDSNRVLRFGYYGYRESGFDDASGKSMRLLYAFRSYSVVGRNVEAPKESAHIYGVINTPVIESGVPDVRNLIVLRREGEVTQVYSAHIGPALPAIALKIQSGMESGEIVLPHEIATELKFALEMRSILRKGTSYE